MSIANMPRVYAPIATKSPTMRALQDRFADVANVKDFGAVGDGTTDDTEAFVAAVAAVTEECGLAADTVQLVFIPAGTYLLSEDVDGFFVSFGGVEITGEGTIKHYNLFSILNSWDLENTSVQTVTELSARVASLTTLYNTVLQTLEDVQKTQEEHSTKLTALEESLNTSIDNLTTQIAEVEESSQTRTLKVEYNSNASSVSQSSSSTASDANSVVAVDYTTSDGSSSNSSDSSDSSSSGGNTVITTTQSSDTYYQTTSSSETYWVRTLSSSTEGELSCGHTGTTSVYTWSLYYKGTLLYTTTQTVVYCSEEAIEKSNTGTPIYTKDTTTYSVGELIDSTNGYYSVTVTTITVTVTTEPTTSTDTSSDSSSSSSSDSGSSSSSSDSSSSGSGSSSSGSTTTTIPTGTYYSSNTYVLCNILGSYSSSTDIPATCYFYYNGTLAGTSSGTVTFSAFELAYYVQGNYDSQYISSKSITPISYNGRVFSAGDLVPGTLDGSSGNGLNFKFYLVIS